MDRTVLEAKMRASIEMIRQKAGDNGKVIVLVSGGVDSMVTAALLQRALREDQIYSIHVDHGFMRKDESAQVIEALKAQGLKHITFIDAKADFWNSRVEVGGGVFAGPITEVTDPEDKRGIVGRAFIDVTDRAILSLGLDPKTTFIAQGTLKPDIIESGNTELAEGAEFVKTHHNDVGIVRQMRAQGRIIETNWDMFKEEVRALARMLGVDERIASRQPFPGPGLAVRLICSGGPLAPDPAADGALEAFIRSAAPSMSARVAPIRSVGVENGRRSYRRPAVVAGGGLGADMAAISAISSSLTAAVPGVNRCVFALNRDKLDAPLIGSECRVSDESVGILRSVDAIVTECLDGRGATQFFAALIPVSAGRAKYSAVVRAVMTTDYMTARAAVPGVDFGLDALEKICSRIAAELPREIDMVLYDFTDKPPATIEWE